MLNILNLGGGVQSSTVLRMSLSGELPQLDHVIFADTGWEPKAVYQHMETLKAECEDAGVPLHVVSRGNIKQDALNSQRVLSTRHGTDGRWGSMPYYVLNDDGTRGIVRRQCTSEYKIEVIEHYTRQDILGLKPRSRWPKDHCIRRWFGISVDEFTRTRKPERTCESYYYPLVQVEFFTDKTIWGDRAKSMTRQTCLEWHAARGLPNPPRSACIGCPFHSDAEWLHLKEHSPDEFEDACQFDELMRDTAGMDGALFLHRSCVPLREVEFKREANLPLFTDECLGMCGA